MHDATDNTDNTVASRPELMERHVMRNALQRLTAAIVALLILAILAGRTAWAQTTTATETRTFEVIAVVGDRVVVQEPAGTREYTIPPGFRFTVDGKRVNVSDLKPGMKGTATITTTTVKPVQVTSVVDAEVVRVSGPAVIVRGPKSLQMFSPGDVERRSVTIHRDGRLVELSDLREGDRLTATIVTEGTPKVLTEREVEAALAAVPVAAAPLPSPPASAPATAPFSEPPAASAPPARVPATSAARTETATGVARFLIPGAVLLAVLIVVLLVHRRSAA